ncbi:hypothetical protein KFE25_009362 [Diacronema lutheri]|uniref:Uncharacterized protein n=1 Tax=Diacronema lutheri TaxID=2081491 RepID=A0A8J5XXN9_DIALT|nr:hypothetical protein KFE25_009362 [Diacronema lutheri]
MAGGAWMVALALLAPGWTGLRARAPSPRLRGARSAAATQMCALPARADDELVDALMAAARAGDVTAVDDAFDRVPHASMVRVHELAAQGVMDAVWVVRCMEDVMRSRMADGASKLRVLLESGEITRMDAALSRLVRDGGADTAFNLVLASNLEHARAACDETMAQLYTHLSTRVQEELEKRAAPAVGLLHRLLRTPDAGLRERVLVDFLAPKTSVALPGAEPIALATPAPPKVTAAQFGDAVRGAVAALASVELRGETVAESVEECRAVAKQAREVVAQHCTADELDAFSRQLAPVFAPFQARQ